MALVKLACRKKAANLELELVPYKEPITEEVCCSISIGSKVCSVSISSLIANNNDSTNVMITSFNSKTKSKSNDLIIKQLRQNMANYLSRFCEIAIINPINCGPILNWFEVIYQINFFFH